MLPLKRLINCGMNSHTWSWMSMTHNYKEHIKHVRERKELATHKLRAEIKKKTTPK